MSIPLPSAITMKEAAAVHQQVQAAIEQASTGGAVAVDAAELSAFDTSALAVMLAAHRAVQAKGLRFDIQRAPSKLGQLAALYGVAELLGLQAGGM